MRKAVALLCLALVLAGGASTVAVRKALSARAQKVAIATHAATNRARESFYRWNQAAEDQIVRLPVSKEVKLALLARLDSTRAPIEIAFTVAYLAIDELESNIPLVIDGKAPISVLYDGMLKLAQAASKLGAAVAGLESVISSEGF